MRRLLGCLVLALFTVIAPLSAHEGHDHQAEAVLVPDAQTPRLLHSKSPIEAVAQFDARGLSIWVDDYASNQALSGLQVSVNVQGAVLQAKEIEPGLYQLPRDLFSGAEVALEIQLKPADARNAVDAHFSGTLPLPAVESESGLDSIYIVVIVVGVLILLGLLLLIGLRRRR